LVFGAILNLLLAAGVALGTARGVLCLPHGLRNLALLVLLLVALLCHFGFRDRLFWAQWVPLPNALTLADPLPPLLGAFLGCIATRFTGPCWHKVVQVALLVAVALFAAYTPLLSPQPPTAPRTRWRGGVALQTSNATCGAASAVTLLQAHGIRATEKEIAVSGRTSNGGTPLLGIYRALRQKTVGTRKSVRVLTGADEDALRDATQHGPVFVNIGIERWDFQKRVWHARAWWHPGDKHAIVVFRFLPNDRIEVGDPSVGREVWNRRLFSTLWLGEGVYLN
jgi:hypothetical protein